MAALRSAFEGAWGGDSTRSASSAGSWGSEDEANKRIRIVGFPDFPEGDLPASEISRISSCTLEERPKRQSSLAQQLNLYAFEQQPPKLRLINTKTPAKGRNRAGAQWAPGARPTAAALQPAAANSSRLGNLFGPEIPQTIPSGPGLCEMRRGSSGSSAVKIPIGLTKAYTAPEPLPELPEELVKLLAASGPKASTPEPGPARVLNGAGSKRYSPSSPATAQVAERAATAQVAALREALRHEQEEVARLRREVAKLTTKYGSADTPMAAPVTPDAADKAQNEATAMELSPARTLPIDDGFATHWRA